MQVLTKEVKSRWMLFSTARPGCKGALSHGLSRRGLDTLSVRGNQHGAGTLGAEAQAVVGQPRALRRTRQADALIRQTVDPVGAGRRGAVP